MKKYLLILCTFICTGIMAQQQADAVGDEMPEKSGKIGETIEAIKTAFITKELDLKPEEAQKFWPVYNEFMDEIKKAKVNSKDDVVGFEEKKVVILKKYQDSFKKVLGSDDRVKKCFNAGTKFHQLLRKEWIRRQGIRRPNGVLPPLPGNGAGNQQPKHFSGNGERRGHSGLGKP